MNSYPQEAYALARIRVDRKHGQGTFDSLRSLVESMGAERGVGAAVEKDLAERLMRATDDIRDVLSVVGPLDPPADASPWLRSAITRESGPVPMGIDDLRGLAIAHLVETVPAGRFVTGTVLPGPVPDPHVPEVMREPLVPETVEIPFNVDSALFLVERLVRDEGRPGVALLLRMAWDGMLRDLREDRTWRMLVDRMDESGLLALGIVATADGKRSLFLAPLESPEAWQEITYGRVKEALKGFSFTLRR